MLALHGRLAFVIDTNGKLVPMDLTILAQPRVLPAYDVPGGVVDIALQGNLAYVASGDGLWIVDVGAPDAPRLLSRVLLPPSRRQVAALRVTGDVAFLYGVGVTLVDVADSARPRVRGGYPSFGDAQLVGDTMYLAADSLQVLQVRPAPFAPDLALPLVGR